MAYVAVVKALYDYAAQDPETELALKEDQIFYVVEKEDEDWWKAKLKDEGGDEGPIGLIPAAYVEEQPLLNTTRALYAYESTSPEELSMNEEDALQVFSIEEDWLLVRPESDPSSKLGFVPRTYCEQLDDAAGVEVADADEAEADLAAHRQEEEEAEERRQMAERQRLLKLKDKVETWSISEMDGKKKKKGTLGVGNGAVFFASDSDKMSGVKQYNITELTQVSQPSSKNLELYFSSASEPLLFHCGSSSNTSAIVAKLESSKEAAGEVLELTRTESRGAASEEEEHDDEDGYAGTPAAAEPKQVRWASDAPGSGGASGETATVLYDFDAQGDDELSVRENEVVTVTDKENDEWWSVRNASGDEGVVPAQYVQLDDGSAAQAGGAQEDDAEEERRHQEEEAAAAASLEAERQRAASKKAEERRAIEKAARERQRQEEEDRKYAEHLEQKEAAKAERRARRHQEEQQMQREHEAAKRREAARGLEPPKVTKRPSAQDVHEAARSLPTRGKQAPIKPPENNRPKPTAGRTRMWNDKSGQFKVEAEYLGLNGNKIRLHKMNGVIIEVPMEKMSTEDVQLIRRHEARKAKASAAEDEDNMPLGRQQQQQKQRQPSEETKARSKEPVFQEPPAEAFAPQKPRKPRFDWFAFFLDAGCDMDDCTRYAVAFERDRMDEELLPELDASTLRGLGLKEGDVIRVRRVIAAKYAEKTPEQLAQIKQDEDYARQLQEHENSGGKGPIPQPPPSLFTSSDGKLANNTRRGRPDKKSTGPESVDASAIAAVSEQLTGVSVSSPSPPSSTALSPAPEKQEKQSSLLSGFDDDAWTIKPSTSKPASPAPPPAPAPPAPPAAVATPPPANPTESLLAQISAMRPASTGVQANTTGGSSNFDKYAAMVGQPNQQQRTGNSPMQPMQTGASNGGGYGGQGYGLGVQGSQQTMGQMQNGPRGPLAPVPGNEGLLNPLQPAQTGFVPTRRNGGGMMPQQTGFSPQSTGFQQPQQTGFQPQQTGFQPQQTGFQPQQTGFQQQPMGMQPTGYSAGFQQGYGGQPQQQQMQPNFTGYPGNFAQQSQASSFNAIANMRPPEPQQQQQNPDKFAPSNIFAAMKTKNFGQPEEQQPQDSNKYDALRPLTTGYNGAPGMMPQQTGMGMMPQQTGMAYPGMMMNQMTGFNPQQQQQGQGGYGYGGYGQGYR